MLALSSILRRAYRNPERLSNPKPSAKYWSIGLRSNTRRRLALIVSCHPHNIQIRSMTPLRPKLEQSLGWIVLAILLVCCLLVLLPFVSALLWAVVLSFSIWPLYRRLLNLLGGRRTLAALLMALAMVSVILL